MFYGGFFYAPVFPVPPVLPVEPLSEGPVAPTLPPVGAVPKFPLPVFPVLPVLPVFPVFPVFPALPVFPPVAPVFSEGSLAYFLPAVVVYFFIVTLLNSLGDPIKPQFGHSLFLLKSFLNILNIL